MDRLILAVGLILFSNHARAWGDKLEPKEPAWISELPIVSGYYYALGVGEAELESEARKTADQEAIGKLFETVFGIRYSSKSETTSSKSSDSLKIDSSAVIDSEFLDKIEHTSFYSKKSAHGKTMAYQLVRVNKADADRRKKASNDFFKGHKPGHLSIESDPAGAVLYIDGIRHSETPLGTTLVPGKYRLKIVKSGFKDYEKSIQIRRGEKISIDVTLEKATGTLNISCDEKEAILKVDGNLIEGEKNWSVEVSAGSHKISVESKGFQDLKKTVFIQSQEEKEIKVVLKSNSVKRTIKNPDGQLSFMEREARSLGDQGLWGELIKHCRGNRNSPSFKSNSFFYEAVALNQMALYSQALDALIYSIATSNDAVKQDLACTIYGNLKDYKEAIKRCDEAIDLDPVSSGVYLLTKARVLKKEFYDTASNNVKVLMGQSYIAASKLNRIAKKELLTLCRKDPYEYSQFCVR